MLLEERRIDEMVIRKLLGWRHSGFSFHKAVRIGPHDAEIGRAVAEYILRSPFSQDRLPYHAQSETMIHGSKMHPVLKRNFEVFSVCDWLAALTAHIPNAGEHLVRHYGWYSDVNRGKRQKAEGESPTTVEASIDISAPSPVVSSAGAVVPYARVRFRIENLASALIRATSAVSPSITYRSNASMSRRVPMYFKHSAAAFKP